MLELKPAVLYLDEADHVYLPLLGPSRSCLRLNKPASTLWRRWIDGPVDDAALADPERAFLHDLLAKGALTVDRRDRDEGGSHGH